jgi:hypothetical protein
MNSHLIEFVDKLSGVSSSEESDSSEDENLTKKPEYVDQFLEDSEGYSIPFQQKDKKSGDIVGDEGKEPTIWVAEYLGNSETKVEVAKKL